MTTLDLIAPTGALTDHIARRLCTEYLTTLVELATEVTTWSTSWTELLCCAVDITNTEELIVCGCCNRPVVLTVADDEEPDRPGTATVDIIRVLNHQDRILTEHRYHRPPSEPPRGPQLDLPAQAL
ncbi:hypothetical protein [Nocardia sp. NPDC003963]